MTKARDLANVEAKATLTDTQTLTNKTLTSPVLGGTTTTASGNLAVQPATYVLEVKGGASTEGAVQLNCAVNTHGQIIKSQPHAQAASNTLLLPGGTTIGNSNAVLVSDTGTQSLTNKTLTSAVLTGTLTAGGSVGTNGQFLQSTGTGVQYATPSSGGMTLLNSGGTTLTGASVTISSISQDYKNLYVLLKNVVLSANNILGLRLNGDTGNNYAFVGISPSSSGSSTIIAGNPDDKYTLARDVGTLTTALNKGQIEFTITRYTDTDQVAIFSNAYSVHTNTDFQSTFFTGVYDCSAAITSLTVKPNSGTFSGGTIYVYGVN